MVKTYSKNKDGNLMLSPHFAVREFACKGGATDMVLISASLIDKLEQIYTYLNCSKIIVNSGYRTPAHDKTVGGNGKGQHTLGKAADIQCYDKDGNTIHAKYVCCAAETLGCNGIGYISSRATHVDVREGKWWGDETTGNNNIASFYGYFGVAKPSVPTNAPDTYTVVKGDTLTAIANRYNCTVLDLTLLNGITNSNIINVGQIIKLPNKSITPVESTHIVAKGDTLWDIAKRYNTTVPKLIAINNIANPGLIEVGQVIKLPNKATAPVTPTNPYSKSSANIRYGDRGDGVKWLQWLLVQKGYSVGSSGIDGIFGSDTLTAVKKFQKDMSLTADGIVGPLTKAKL